MKTKDAIEHAGDAATLAKLLGITQSAICQWGDGVPDKRIWQLKVLRPKWFRKQTADDMQAVMDQADSADAITDNLMAEAAKAGLIERRRVVRNTDDTRAYAARVAIQPPEA